MSIFRDKRAAVTVALKHLLAYAFWDVAFCWVVSTLLCSAGEVAPKCHGKYPVDEVLFAEVAVTLLGLSVK